MANPNKSCFLFRCAYLTLVKPLCIEHIKQRTPFMIKQTKIVDQSGLTMRDDT